MADTQTNEYGVFIVIEGTEGSSKTTQFRMLAKHLQAAGHDVALFEFPRYEEPAGYFVKKYVQGGYGSGEAIGPYTVALFYALDRFDAAAGIRQALQAGKVVLSDRFTGSSMAHQATKFDTPEERRGFFIWLDNLEFGTLRIPRPDLNIVLRVPAELNAPSHDTQQAVKIYDDLCQLFPKDFSRIDCTRSNERLDDETVSKLISEKVAPYLPKVKHRGHHEPITALTPIVQDSVGKLSRYYIPNTFDPDIRHGYSQAMDSILKAHDILEQRLAAYLREQTTTPKDERDGISDQLILAQAAAAARAVLPIATHTGLQNNSQSQNRDQDQASMASLKTVVPDWTKEELPTNHTATPAEAVSLTSSLPRNELDLLATILYEYSDLSLRELQNLLSLWPYERKLTLLQKYLSQRTQNGRQHHSGNDTISTALDSALYGWDIVSDCATFLDLQQSQSFVSVQHQPLTPRLGYDVPRIIEDAGLTDQYETCFDASLRLYSLLQQTGYGAEACYATLHGHRLRWSANQTLRQLFEFFWLSQKPDFTTNKKLAEQMLAQLAEAHPLLAEAAITTTSSSRPAI